MNTWKLRLLVIGGINLLIAVAVMAARGFSAPMVGLFLLGVAVMALGLRLWR